MRGKRGISTVVATVLIILILVASIAIIWVAILALVQELSLDVPLPQIEVVDSKGYTVCDSDMGTLLVQVKRGNDDANIENVVLHLGIEGNTVSWPVTAPRKNSYRTYNFPLSAFGGECVDTASVAPLYTRGSGIKEEGVITSKIDIPENTIDGILPFPESIPPGIGPTCGDGNLDVGEVCDDGNTVSFDGCSSVCQNEPTGNLIAWWDFDGDVILPPSIIQDKAPLGIYDGGVIDTNGVISIIPSTVPYPGFGDLLYIDDDAESFADYIQVGHFTVTNPLDGLTEATLVGWVKKDLPDSRVVFGVKERAGGFPRGSFLIEAEDDNIDYLVRGEDDSTETGYDHFYNDVSWHHVAMVFNGSEASSNDRVKVYFDGSLEVNGSYKAAELPSSLRFGGLDPYFVIGINGANGLGGSHGQFDDIRIYDFALSEEQVGHVMTGNDL